MSTKTNSQNRLNLSEDNKAAQAAKVMHKEFEQRIIASPPGVCPIELQLSFLKVCHAQSCGKCVPCRIGLGKLADLIEEVLDGKATMETLKVIMDTAKTIEQSADCAIGFEAGHLMAKAVEGLYDDFVSHIQNHKCIKDFEQPIPCVDLCPAHVDIPGYISLVEAGKYDDAVRLIRQDNPFPTACALICENPCETHCRRTMIDDPINIRGLKRSAVEFSNFSSINAPEKCEVTGKKIAIIGGGPSGLTAAYFLQLMGHDCTVFEEKPQLGGMLRYGIPNYRFPRIRLQEDLDHILSTGINVKYNTKIGRDVTIQDLTKNYDAIYLAIGAQINKNFKIEGGELKNVFAAVDLLRYVGLEKRIDFTGKKVAVIGGGNVAMDCARTAVRAGAKNVTIAYRRQEKDMTAAPIEVRGAIEEGVDLYTLYSPVKIEGDANGDVTGLIVQPQIPGLYDKNGRPKSGDAQKDTVKIPADVVLIAIGQDIESEYFEENGIPTNWKRIVADEGCFVPDLPGIFAGGDCVTGPATVIKAIAAGKVAAANIDKYLGFNHKISVKVDVPEPLMNDKDQIGRINLTERDPKERKNDFNHIENCMSKEETKQEASKCLRCDNYGCSLFRGGIHKEW